MSAGPGPFQRRDGRVGRLLLHCMDLDNGRVVCRLCGMLSPYVDEPPHRILHDRKCPLPAACRALGYPLPNIDRNGKRTFKPQPQVAR